jgi:RNA polymerase sigma-70 factor (ECF subfamily)
LQEIRLLYTIFHGHRIKIVKKNTKPAEQEPASAHPETRNGMQWKKKDLENRPNSLVVRLKKGEHQAAVELVDIYYKQIYLYFRRLGHNCQTSEDLTQETFMSAWHSIYQLRENNALTSWLYHIAGNNSRLYWRRHKNEKPSSPEISNNPPAEKYDFEQFDELEKLRKAVEELPIKLRQAIIMHYMQELTIEKAAQAAQIKVGTFKSRLNRALNKLRKKIV